MTQILHKQVFFLIPRLDSIATNKFDFFTRINEYGRELSNQTNGKISKIYIVCNTQIPIELMNYTSTFKFLNIIVVDKKSYRILKFMRAAKKIISDSKIVNVQLIAGDLFVGNLVSIILAKIVSPSPKKQISIHGSIFHGKNYFRNFIFEKFKHIFLRITLKRFDTIRVVSESLKSEIIYELGLPEEKFIIAPIPILLPEHDQNKKRDLSLVVVGRLHIERNLHEILLILDGVLSFGRLKQVTFVGSGPMLSLVENWRKLNAEKCNISVLGSLSHAKTLSEISSHQILLSSAISEGYGLTIRESILEGTHVLARKNSGTVELSKIFGDVVHLYTTPQEAILFIQKNIDYLDKFDVRPFKIIQESLDQKYLSTLIKSWIN